MRPVLKTALDAVTANADSEAIPTDYQVACSLQVITTGTATGTLKMQFSNDRDNPTHWSDIPNASITISAAGVTNIPKTDICYKWIKVNLSGFSGTGTVTANYNSFGF